VATTAAQGVILGCELTEAADADSLQGAYGVLFDEAGALDPRWRPMSVCLDGWQAARAAWRRLSPKTVQVRCYLHEMLNLRKEAHKKKRRELLEQGWDVYQAPTRGSFSQRLRRFEEKVRKTLGRGWWARQVKARLARMRGRLSEYACTYSLPGAHRTSNQVDRQMQSQARQLAGQRGMRGRMETGKQTMRAMGLVHNFHEYGPRTRRLPGNERRHSPFGDLNGKVYSDDWLENLLLASSCGGLRI